ncbi:MAG: division/cell wall cluster transcriptional repressor MraZ [Ruminococcus sp.]|nr:division/cell wall cluster transcriptional repressor MraZ [Ruminococcus sp.]
MLQKALMGNFSQSMDVKGRMSFPQKLREIIGDRFIVTKGIDGCLFVYSLEDFDRICKKLMAIPMIRGRAIQRNIMSWAIEVEADKQGRILIPQNLREQASLEKEIIVAGVFDRCEIWDKKHFDEINSGVDDEELMKALEGTEL